MDSEEQEHILEWEGIEIQVAYCPGYSGTYSSITGSRLVHLEIRSSNRERLPMTGTGYRSWFCPADEIESFGSPVAYVKAWLDEAAKGREWLAHKKSFEQVHQFTLS